MTAQFKKDKECVNSVRFKCVDKDFPIRTVYVDKGEFTEEDEIGIGIRHKEDTSF